MNRTGHRDLSLLLALTLLSGPVAAGLGSFDPERKLKDSTEVYRQLLDTGEVPDRLLERSRCIAVLPGVIKGAVGWGGRHGRGVVSCRNEEEAWSPPIFLRISGGSFGLQIGGESTDLVLFFTSERGARSLLDSRFTLGADVSVAAGPVGRSAQAATDLKLKAEIYAYAKSRGLFAGVAVEGARLAPSQKAIEKYYGERLWPDEVLFEHHVPEIPAEALAFIKALSEAD